VNDGSLRVMLFNSAPELHLIESAYHEVSSRLASVPGLLGNELLRSVDHPTEFIVLSSWRDLAAFRQWEQGAEHRASTAALRPFRQVMPSRAFGLYQVTAAY
jgi:heme-degrading monooxygenase HmoA